MARAVSLTAAVNAITNITAAVIPTRPINTCLIRVSSWREVIRHPDRWMGKTTWGKDEAVRIAPGFSAGSAASRGLIAIALIYG